jgi:hypothetical protein
MKERYDEMVRSPITTLWELWDPKGGSHDHSYGPITALGKYAAGVAPLEPGYRKFRVAPHLGPLNKIDAKVPTVKGEIDVHVLRKVSNGVETIDVSTNVPKGTTVMVGVPKLRGDASRVKLRDTVIWENGVDVAGSALLSVGQDNQFVYYESTEDVVLTGA